MLKGEGGMFEAKCFEYFHSHAEWQRSVNRVYAKKGGGIID